MTRRRRTRPSGLDTFLQLLDTCRNRLQRVLCVDPGTSAGWCLMVDQAYDSSGTCNGSQWSAAVGILDKHDPDLVVIEDQHRGKFKDPHSGRLVTASWESIKGLLYRRHLWEILALERGALVVAVNPQTWQAWAGVRKGDSARMAAVARAVIGRPPANPDEGVAVVLGQFFAGAARMAAATTQGPPSTR